MTNEADWITARIGESQKLYPSITTGAATRMGELLRGELKERTLSGTELEHIAAAFIADEMPEVRQTPGTLI